MKFTSFPLLFFSDLAFIRSAERRHVRQIETKKRMRITVCSWFIYFLPLEEPHFRHFKTLSFQDATWLQSPRLIQALQPEKKIFGVFLFFCLFPMRNNFSRVKGPRCTSHRKEGNMIRREEKKKEPLFRLFSEQAAKTDKIKRKEKKNVSPWKKKGIHSYKNVSTLVSAQVR